MSQSDFRAALLNADAPVPAGLFTPDGAPATRRFNVYRNNVAVGLTEALETAFPVVRKLVGDTFFKAMAGVYLRNHPPTSPLMMFYGDQTPSFLKGFKPVQHLAYLPDIARLEIALRESYHAADAAPITAETFAALAPDAFARARVAFAPAVRLLSSRHPLYGIWAANALADAPPIVKAPEDVLVTRRSFDPKPHRLDRATATFVATLLRGDPISAAIASARAVDIGFDLGGALGLLLSEGAITDIT